jgi:RNA polymerase sigma-70 factor (ECF subfamily)
MPLAIRERELEAVRRRGFGVAYRMLGSVTEAEDVVQEALLRMTRSEERIAEPAAWITTVTTRLSIDVLRAARVRRETYVGPWLPEPLIEDVAAEPAARVERDESLSQAFLVLLERLTPLERAAFLLREVFDYDYPEIAEALDRSEASCRQLVSRARRHLASDQVRFDADESLREDLLERFLAAAEEGDLEAFEELLARDAVLYSDGGGKVIAARRPIAGARRIGRAFAAFTHKQRERGIVPSQRVRVNGEPGLVLREPDGEVWEVLSIDVVDGRINTVRIMRNPDKLRHV